jgi:hypothetical protein
MLRYAHGGRGATVIFSATSSALNSGQDAQKDDEPGAVASARAIQIRAARRPKHDRPLPLLRDGR